MKKFPTPADVAIPVRPPRENLDWEVTDFWGDPVDRGTFPWAPAPSRPHTPPAP